MTCIMYIGVIRFVLQNANNIFQQEVKTLLNLTAQTWFGRLCDYSLKGTLNRSRRNFK